MSYRIMANTNYRSQLRKGVEKHKRSHKVLHIAFLLLQTFSVRWIFEVRFKSAYHTLDMKARVTEFATHVLAGEIGDFVLVQVPKQL